MKYFKKKGEVMNKIFSFFLIVFLFFGCAKKEKIVVQIDNIKITKDEFEKNFTKFNIDKPDAEQAKKEFLENLINRKLILKEAEKLGLDKDTAFLESVQDFWEQSLLKLVLEKKSKELFLNINVSDKEIEDFFNANKEKFVSSDISSSYEQIKILILKEKQRKAIENWLSSLKNKAKIKINYKELGLGQ
ncbi:MAG: SurA N-terminal domain-containing protein [Candidatus Aenigmatarchaeota archaeon]